MKHCAAVAGASVQHDGGCNLPTLTVGMKTPGTPIRTNCLPVIKAAREAVQTEQPEYLHRQHQPADQNTSTTTSRKQVMSTTAMSTTAQPTTAQRAVS